MARVLAFDIGTSSARAQLYGDGAEPVGGPIERLHYEPNAAGELALEPIVRFVEGALASAGEVDTVAWSTLWHSLIALDENDRPLTEVSTWLDPRAGPDAKSLQQELDAAAIHVRTGAPIHPSFWPAKLRRLRREAVPFARVATVGDYLRLRVDGVLATSVSLASGTGLLDVHPGSWDGELLAALGLDEEALPPLADDGVWLGDGAAANIGAGCVDGCPVVTIGTSSALRVIRRDASTTPGLFLYRLDRRRFVLGGSLSDGGNLLATIARLTGGDIGDALDRPPGRVLLLPHLGGERTPGWRVDAAGVMTGVTHSTQSLDIAQAAYEGIAYRIGTIWDLLRSSWSDWSSQTNLASEVDQVREVVATGAALLARPGWAQLLSDVLGMPVAMAPTTEASARGAAMVALGIEDAPTPLGPRFEPRPERTAQHREARERLDTLYRAIASA